MDALKEKQEDNNNALHLLRKRWDEETENQEALAAEAKKREKETLAKQRLLRLMNLSQCTIRLYHKTHQANKGKKPKKGGKNKKKKGKGKKKKKKT